MLNHLRAGDVQGMFRLTFKLRVCIYDQVRLCQGLPLSFNDPEGVGTGGPDQLENHKAIGSLAILVRFPLKKTQSH